MAILFPLFGIFTSFILLYYLSSLNRSNIFLALFFLCCNLVVMVYYGLHFTKDLFWEGVSFVHWLPLSYLLGPLLFFYVKTTLSDNNKLKKWDWVHLLPAAFIVINCLPFTTLPFDQKAQIAHEIVNVTENYNLDFNFVSFEFILYSRSIHLLCYAIFSIVYFYLHTKRLLKEYSSRSSNHSILSRWILLLCLMQIVIAINSIGHMSTLYGVQFNVFGVPSTAIFTEKYYFEICGGGFFLQNIFLFLFPKILYGNVSYIIEDGENSIIDDLKLNLPKKQKEAATIQDIEQIIQNYLLNSPFIQKDFSLSQMSFDLKIPERFLSNYFNKILVISFSEWRKNLRIEYVCSLIEAGESKNLTIEAIATNAGFASRSKFIDAFKERKGVTPSAFIKSMSSREA
ncbi:MAG: AraC family transcriptional regulator [Chitinophagia bacterium]|nr:AraC family transcriptional regulator [Chitinophagia bacterium]